MSTETIDEILARVERLDREATKEPWQPGTHEGGFDWFVDEFAAGRRVADGSWNVADAALIAAYRSDAPALAAEVRRLRLLLAERAAAEARAKGLETACTEVDRLLEGVEGFGPSDDEALDAAHAALTAALSDPTPGGP